MASEAKRILIVDDDPELGALTDRVLKDKGFRTVRAANGAEALQTLKAEAADLVLLDIDMPEMDGWAFLEKLDDGQHPPVAFVSGMFSFEAFSRGTRAGVAAFVAKPIHYKELVATCYRVFEIRARRAAAPAGQTRRRSERRQMLVRVDVVSNKGTSRAVGELCDLSVGGAQVITVNPLDVGVHVRFALDAAVTGEPMKFESEVRWRQQMSDGFAHGLELVDVGPEQSDRLVAVLA
jgi:DNA-binding response OmpR family regulator